jgi:hypothetical protein
MSRNRRGLQFGVALVALAGTAVPTAASASAAKASPAVGDTTARRNGVARVERTRRDSTYRARAAMGSGLYVGVGGGTSLPLGEAKDDWKTGWAVFVPVGYDWPSWFGVRVDGSYEHWAGKTEGFTTYGAYKLTGLNADLKARVPLTAGGTVIQLYGLAGGNFDHLSYGESGSGAYRIARGGPTASRAPVARPSAAVAASALQQVDGSETMNKVGWNAGAGLSFGWGVTSLLVESRYFSVSAEGGTLKWYPVVAAITYSFR